MLINCRITGDIFRRFAYYDAFIRKKAMRNIGIFVLISAAFSAVSFAGGGAALGCVFTALAVLLPCVYLFVFASSVKKQQKKLNTASAEPAYTAELFDKERGARITSRSDECLSIGWNDVTLAHRAGNCVYLYISSGKAFLLPCEDSAELWNFLCGVLPEHILR